MRDVKPIYVKGNQPSTHIDTHNEVSGGRESDNSYRDRIRVQLSYEKRGQDSQRPLKPKPKSLTQP